MHRLSSVLPPQWPTLIFAFLLGGLVLDAICGSSGLRRLLVLRQHSSTLAAERDRLRLENADIRDRIARLRSDDAYLEQLIRRDLGYTRPGELVYRFPKSGHP
jgi:cell division protein FtsB